MLADQETIDELVAFIREEKARLLPIYLQEYDRVYGHSHGSELPSDMRVQWIDAMLEGQISDLEGHVDPQRYQSCGGDMVLQHEKPLNQIFVYAEAKLFFARFFAPYVWQRFAADPSKLKKMFDYLEASTQDSIRANMEAFLDRFGQVGTLSSTWEHYAPQVPGSLVRQDTAKGSVDSARAGAAVQEPDGPVSLTAREREIVELVTCGCSNKEICQRLGVGLSTVKNHLGRIFDKYGVQSRTELVALALKGKA